MTKQEFAKWCMESIHILDGATGSNLQKKGMGADVCPEKWIIENPDKLIELQREYLQAGADVVYAPTFGANRIKLKKYGLDLEATSINKELVAISRQAVGYDAKVAGDMTMCGQSLEPIGSLTIEELIDVYKEQALALYEAGVDFIVVETMMSLQEIRAAVIAIQAVCDLPIMVTMTFENNGRTLYGTDAKTAVTCLQQMNVDAFGANCGAGPDKIISVVEEISKYSEIPIVVKPNAGLPKSDGEGNVTYDMNPEEFALEMNKLIEYDVAFIGGCCGTTPDYIREISSMKSRSLNRKEKVHQSYVSSERVSMPIAEATVSETIFLNKFPDMIEDIKDEIFDDILDIVEDKMDDYDVIDICLDGIDAASIKKLVNELSQVPNILLGFEATEEEVYETALLNYPGIAFSLDSSTHCKTAVLYGTEIVNKK